MKPTKRQKAIVEHFVKKVLTEEKFTSSPEHRIKRIILQAMKDVGQGKAVMNMANRATENIMKIFNEQ